MNGKRKKGKLMNEWKLESDRNILSRSRRGRNKIDRKQKAIKKKEKREKIKVIKKDRERESKYELLT